MRNTIYTNLKTPRDYTSSTGITKAEFDIIATDFCELYQVAQHQFPQNFGNQPAFPDGKELLFMLLYYKKTALTFDLLALSFGVARSTAHNHIEVAKIILKAVLDRRKLLPVRFFKTETDVQEFFKDTPDLMIDAVERQMQRPGNQEKQESAYSIKKKFCAFKNTVVTTRNKFIYFLSKTVLSGKTHDFNLLKQDFLAFPNAFASHTVWVDLGYLGIDKVWNIGTVRIPHKIPRRSKKNPNPVLSPSEKEYNKFVGKNRVVVENSIAGMKRYNILVNKFRNRTIESADGLIELCAGLWNFKVARRLQMNL